MKKRRTIVRRMREYDEGKGEIWQRRIKEKNKKRNVSRRKFDWKKNLQRITDFLSKPR